MCIRDRFEDLTVDENLRFYAGVYALDPAVFAARRRYILEMACLLYASDAADERSSGDLGGRRIIKKKKQQHTY